jgi:hypothetical protein
VILFSIPVHERPDVVANQIENFGFFNPGCQVVLHASAKMPDEVFKELQEVVARYPSVRINEARLLSGHADGTQMKMHVVNILYAQRLGIQYDYFCPHASNDMFVRDGAEASMAGFDAGGMCHEGNRQSKGWVHMVRAFSDGRLRKMMRLNGLQKLFGGQLEGSFYRREIIEKVAERIMTAGMDEIPGIYSQGYSTRLYGLLNGKRMRAVLNRTFKGMFYAKEEIYFCTLSQDLVKKRKAYNCCYVNWGDNLKVTKQDIDNIRAKNFAALPYIDKMAVPITELDFYAVKRVDRRIDDAIRVYITSLQK